MPPKKKCSCKIHDSLSNSDSPVWNIDSSKKLKKCALKYLQENGHLESYHKYLCEGCYAHGVMNCTTEKYSFSEFCHHVEEGNISDEQFEQLSMSFAKLLKLKIRGCKSNVTLATLTNMDVAKMWNSCDILRTFLLNLSQDNSSFITMLNAYEILLQLTNPKYIGPLNFAKTIISYFISGSRRLVELNSSFSPSGSYATVLEFLKNKAVTDMNLPSNDCIFFFDNNQILARSWKVQYNCKPLISVVTTVVSLVPPTLSSLQKCVDFMPGKWMSALNPVTDTIFQDTSVSFRGERNVYIEDSIKKITGNDCLPPNKLRKVDFASGRARSTAPEVNDPYADITSFVGGQTKVFVLEPVMVNPCSYQSLSTVLDNIIEKTDKAWIIVGCDGLPYSLCSKIIENHFICSHCDVLFEKKEKFRHHIEVENLDIDISDCQKYKNVLLIPGFGHIDINVTKALFKLMWCVCIKDLALLLGWKSIKALTSCENCTDHHKATQILNILMTSLTETLLKPFVCYCEMNSQPPTIENLYDFVSKQNSNYQFLFKCNFTYLLAWKMLKKGMRRANFEYMKMSMDKLSALFYGLNMTNYMELWYRFELTMARAPEPVRKFLQQHLCMSQSGHPSKGEGGDFILEATNKKIKSYMPHGVPTDDRWRRVYSNLENIEKIQCAMQPSSSVSSHEANRPNQYFRKFSDPVAVEEYSKKLSAYFSRDDGKHTTTDSKELDWDLVNFDIKCEENKRKYYQYFPDVLRICERIFVTPQERAPYFDIGNKPKAEIQKIITCLLKDIEDAGGDEEASVLRQQWSREVKNGTKPLLLTFYKDVIQCLEDVTGKRNLTDCGSEDDENVQ